jgi:hypothetical protein
MQEAVAILQKYWKHDSFRPLQSEIIQSVLSGKDTFLRTIKNLDYIEISRDKILLEIANTKDYRQAYSLVDSKIIDKELNRQIIQYCSLNKNIIANMTHLKAKRRISTLARFNKEYYKIAIVFPIITKNDFSVRNDKRNKEEKKIISIKLYDEMVNLFELVNEEEGFDKVIDLERFIL